ncbi:unnamed protein product [Closterium sp. NIES-53]
MPDKKLRFPSTLPPPSPPPLSTFTPAPSNPHPLPPPPTQLHQSSTTALLQGSLHEEIWLRRPPGFTGTFPAGTQWSLRRPVYGLRQVPREWHDTLRTTLAALGFAPSTADPSLFLRTNTSLPLFYVIVYVDDLVFATADTEALTLVKSELQKRHTCTDLGEQSFSALASSSPRCSQLLCHEHRLEHIALRYFLARELQQHGQLRLAYVATRANTTDVFTKALPPGDHQRFTTVLGLLALLFLTGLIRAVRLQLREQFRQDLPVLCLHSDRGGEFSSDLLRDFCHGEGILQSFTLSDSPQQNGIVECRIGLVMEFARTSMIHAAAPHFLWPFVFRYVAHQLNLWPRVSLPETSPTLRWTGKVGDASVFQV